MGIRQSLLMIQMTAAMLSADLPQPSFGNAGPSPDEIERERLTAQERYRANLAKKGAKEYHINGHTVIARSFENAVKKVKKLSNG